MRRPTIPRRPGRSLHGWQARLLPRFFANALPGFFPLSSTPVQITDPLAAEFVGWREECESTIRSTYQILSRGTPNLENDTWGASVAAIKGTSTPQELGQKLQDGLASWYEPQQ